MATNREDKFAYVIQMSNNYTLQSEPFLLILDEELTIAQNEGKIGGSQPNIKVTEIVQLNSQQPVSFLQDNVTIGSDNRSKYLIYKENNNFAYLPRDCFDLIFNYV